MDLADALEIGDYPCPSGGCLLTDKNFARLVRDAVVHDELELKIIARLKTGHHFRLGDDDRLIVGRDEQENNKLVLMAGSDTILEPTNVVGPNGLLVGPCSAAILEKAATILAGYCDGDGNVAVSIKSPQGESTLEVSRLDREQNKEMRI